MYVCMHVLVDECVQKEQQHAHRYVSVWSFRVFVCMHAYIYACMHVCRRLCVEFPHVCRLVCTYVFVLVCMYVCVYVGVSV